MTPLFPLISQSSYIFVANSTTRTPSITDTSGVIVSNPTEDSQGNVVVNLTTDSNRTMGAQFTVEFYSEYNAHDPMALLEP